MMQARPRTRRGFSLVELLVVLSIIVIVVSLIVPALGRVRTTARTQETRNLLTQISQAMSAFQTDNKRLPGYFTPAEMGSAENATRGFSTSQNVMLELAGGLANPADPNYASYPSVGPIAARAVKVNVNTIGTEGGSGAGINTTAAYFTPSEKYYRRQNGVDGGERCGVPEHAGVPELVDAWGCPIVIWVADPAATGPINVSADFARQTWAGNNPPARFYWNSNAAVFGNNGPSGSPYVGSRRIRQENTSLLHFGEAGKVESLVGLLGNPGAPNPWVESGSRPAINEIFPSAARGTFVIHASGPNGIFLGRDERGGRTAIATGTRTLYYGLNFKAPNGSGDINGVFRTDDRGNRASIDILSEFDDLIAWGG
jgi:prepilin-type N-terminal cleavage/methylation domain-containing protein